MVLRLVVQAAEGEVGEPAAADVACRQDLSPQEVGLPDAVRIGMPLWLGAKEQPR
jgi:hypothetical protein